MVSFEGGRRIFYLIVVRTEQKTENLRLSVCPLKHRGDHWRVVPGDDQGTHPKAFGGGTSELYVKPNWVEWRPRQIRRPECVGGGVVRSSSPSVRYPGVRAVMSLLQFKSPFTNASVGTNRCVLNLKLSWRHLNTKKSQGKARFCIER